MGSLSLTPHSLGFTMLYHFVECVIMADKSK